MSCKLLHISLQLILCQDFMTLLMKCILVMKWAGTIRGKVRFVKLFNVRWDCKSWFMIYCVKRKHFQNSQQFWLKFKFLDADHLSKSRPCNETIQRVCRANLQNIPNWRKPNQFRITRTLCQREQFVHNVDAILFCMIFPSLLFFSISMSRDSNCKAVVGTSIWIYNKKKPIEFIKLKPTIPRGKLRPFKLLANLKLNENSA